MNIPLDLVLDEMFNENVYKPKTLDEAITTRVGKNISVMGKLTDYSETPRLIFEFSDEKGDVLNIEYSPLIGLSEKELLNEVKSYIETGTPLKIYGVVDDDPDIVGGTALRLYGFETLEDKKRRIPSLETLEDSCQRFSELRDFVVFQANEKKLLQLLNELEESPQKEEVRRDYARQLCYISFLDKQYILTQRLEEESKEIISIEAQNETNTLKNQF